MRAHFHALSRQFSFVVALAILSGCQTASTETSVRVPGEFHRVETRAHVGIPSLAISPVNGRWWATWYGGKSKGEDLNNYVSLVTSADGKSWKEVLVADPDGAGPQRAFDPELWIAPDGKLRWTWTERLCDPKKGDLTKDYGGDMGDKRTDRVMMATLSAEDEPTAMPEVTDVGPGVMMCKPIVLRTGEWLFPLAHWGVAPSACFYATADGGKTFAYRGGAAIPENQRGFDEHQAVERRDGSLVVYIRANWDSKTVDRHPWMSVSHDRGAHWSPAEPAPFDNISSRIFFRRLASGNWLLVKNGPLAQDVGRTYLTAYLSRDEGRTWEGGLLLDERTDVAYPDGVQRPDGTIAVIYDRNRITDREILYATFSEEDVLAGWNVSGKVTRKNVITRENRLSRDSGSPFGKSCVLIN